MKAVINTLSPSPWEEGTKTIEDLKRPMVPMEEENIKVFIEEKKTSSKEDSQKAFQNRKDLEVVFQISIDALKQIKRWSNTYFVDGNKQIQIY